MNPATIKAIVVETEKISGTRKYAITAPILSPIPLLMASWSIRYVAPQLGQVVNPSLTSEPQWPHCIGVSLSLKEHQSAMRLSPFSWVANIAMNDTTAGDGKALGGWVKIVRNGSRRDLGLRSANGLSDWHDDELSTALTSARR